jgi:hypothetical protein
MKHPRKRVSIKCLELPKQVPNEFHGRLPVIRDEADSRHDLEGSREELEHHSPTPKFVLAVRPGADPTRSRAG